MNKIQSSPFTSLVLAIVLLVLLFNLYLDVRTIRAKSKPKPTPVLMTPAVLQQAPVLETAGESLVFRL